MSTWLDIGIVTLALLGAVGLAWRHRRKKGCAPKKDELVQIKSRKDRGFLAGSRPNR